MNKKLTSKVVICLIVILTLAFILIANSNIKDEKKRHLALRRGNSITYGLKARYVGCSKYPTTEEGLEILATKDCGDYKASRHVLDILTTEKFIYESDGQSYTLRHPIREDIYWTEKGLIDKNE